MKLAYACCVASNVEVSIKENWTKSLYTKIRQRKCLSHLLGLLDDLHVFDPVYTSVDRRPDK